MYQLSSQVCWYMYSLFLQEIEKPQRKMNIMYIDKSRYTLMIN